MALLFMYFHTNLKQNIFLQYNSKVYMSPKPRNSEVNDQYYEKCYDTNFL